MRCLANAHNTCCGSEALRFAQGAQRPKYLSGGASSSGLATRPSCSCSIRPRSAGTARVKSCGRDSSVSANLVSFFSRSCLSAPSARVLQSQGTGDSAQSSTLLRGKARTGGWKEVPCMRPLVRAYTSGPWASTPRQLFGFFRRQVAATLVHKRMGRKLPTPGDKAIAQMHLELAKPSIEVADVRHLLHKQLLEPTRTENCGQDEGEKMVHPNECVRR